MMATAQAEDVKQRISAIWENLQCPICLDLMSVPVTTKCDHQFCKFCMQKLLERSRRREANCPVCKTKVTTRSLQESVAFQRLVAGLQKLVEAYEYDTCTNYFTGLAQRRKPGSEEVRQQAKEFVDVETPEQDGIHEADGSPPSLTPSRAAKEAYAKLMELGDSCSATSDSGLGHLPQASKAEALSSPVQRDDLLPTPTESEDCLPLEKNDLLTLAEREHHLPMAANQQNGVLCKVGVSSSRPGQQPATSEEVGTDEMPERVVVHAKRQTRSSSMLVAKQPCDEEEVVVCRSTRTNRRLDLDVDQVTDGRRKRSLEKVSEWLLKNLPEEPINDSEMKPQSIELRQDNQPEDEHLLRGSSSSSSADTESLSNQINHIQTVRSTNQREEGSRALEKQVFGAVYRTYRRAHGVQRNGRASPERATETSHHPEQDTSGTRPEILAQDYRGPSEVSEPQAQRGKSRGKRRTSTLTPADFIKRPCLVEEPEPNAATEDHAEPEPVPEDSAQDPDGGMELDSVHKPSGSGSNTPRSIHGETNLEPELGQDPEQHGHEVRRQDGKRSLDGSAFEVSVRMRRRKSRAKMQDSWTELDSALSTDGQGRPSRQRDTRGKRAQGDEKPDKRKQPKTTRALTLVSADGEHCPLQAWRTQLPPREAEAQIESYPSSCEVLSPVSRMTRRSKSLVDFTEEVQGVPRRTRAAKARTTPQDRTSTDHADKVQGDRSTDHADKVQGDHSTDHADKVVQGVSRRTRAATAGPAIDHTSTGHSSPEHTEQEQAILEESGASKATRMEAPTPGETRTVHADEVQDESVRTGTTRATVEQHTNIERSTEEREHGDRTGTSRSPPDQAGWAPRRNGCVYEPEMDDIEEMEEVAEAEAEASAQSDPRDASSLSAAVVPHTQTPAPQQPFLAALVNSESLLDAVVPHSRSPAEAVVPSCPPGVSPIRHSPPSAIGAPQVLVLEQDRQAALENAAREPVSLDVEAEVNDSELDTELLLKSFRGSKRKSFHLGSPCHQPESPGLDMPVTMATQREADAQPSAGPSGSVVNASLSRSSLSLVQESETAAFLSCGSDLVPPSDPLQGLASTVVPRVVDRGTGSPTVPPQRVHEGGTEEDSEGRSQHCTKHGALNPSERCRGDLNPECVSDTQGADSCLLPLPSHEPPRQQQQQEDEVVEEEQEEEEAPKARGEEWQHPKPAQTAGGRIPELALNLPEPLHTSEPKSQSFESSMTPDGLVPMDAEGHILLDAEDPVCGAVGVEGEQSATEQDVDTSQPCAVRKRRARKAQRLESSESEHSSDDEELPSLQQIFRPKASPQPISLQGRGSTNSPPSPARRSDSVPPLLTLDDPDMEASECEVIPCSLELPPPNRHCHLQARRVCVGPGEGAQPDEWVGSSQGSQDLFGTPEEDEVVTEVTAGESAEFSQYSSDIINTQQKVEMQAELQRLEQMMALVSEALKQKEAEPGPETAGGASANAAYGNQGAEPTASSLVSPKLRPSNSTNQQQSTHLAEHTPTRDEASAGAPEAGLPASPVDGLGPTQPCNTEITAQGYTPLQGQSCTRRSGRHNSNSSQRSAVKVEMLPEATPTKPYPLQLALSGLSGPQQVEVKRFIRRLGGSVTPQVTSSTTHIIIKTDDDLVCERTLKYFQGIANRKWVVSYLWVSECIRQQELVNEAEFEVCGDVVNGHNHRGPQKARCTQPHNLLMGGFEICLYGPFSGMTTGQMQEMIEVCGGVVVEDPLQFSRKCSSQLVIVQPDPESERNFRFRDLPRSVFVVTRGWLLDSIATYTLQDPENYRPETPPPQCEKPPPTKTTTPTPSRTQRTTGQKLHPLRPQTPPLTSGPHPPEP